jgi:O-antigen ligase
MPRAAIMLGFAAVSGVFITASPWRVLFYLGPLAAAAAVYASGSRGAALALPVLALVAIGGLLAGKGTRRDGIVLAVLLAAGLVALSFVFPLGRLATVGGVLEELLATGHTTDFPTTERLAMYQAAIAAFQLSPWIGHGWGNLGTIAAALDPAHFAAAPATATFMFHNDLLNLAAAAGVVGIACWLALLAAPLVGALSVPADRFALPRLYLCLVLVAGYAVFGLTDIAFGYDLLTIFYALFAAIVAGGVREARTASSAAGPAARL